MLIDRTYFVGDIDIPNSDRIPVAESIDNCIAIYEPMFLKRALGYELNKSFQAGLLEDPVAQKWLDLYSGVEYTNTYNKLDYWEGLLPPPLEDDTVLSPIACYVYYYFMRRNATQTSGMGEVKTTTENAVMASPGMKMQTAWNNMASSLVAMREFLKANTTTYGYTYFTNELYKNINVMNL